MATAYERPKEPDRVRRALLDCGASIAAQDGLPAVTVAAVSAAAGVTKGALFHHFVNKQALVDAMFDDLIAQVDRATELSLEAEPAAFGRFTRTYIDLALTMDAETQRLWSSLIGSMRGHAELTVKWNIWLSAQLKTHAATDAGATLEILRLAADGAWLSSLAGKSPIMIDVAPIRRNLIALSYRPLTSVCCPRHHAVQPLAC